MSNIIAVIWDCDKTLIDGYMQDPIFKDFGIDGSDFWNEMNAEKQKIKDSGVRVNDDIFAINYIIKCARSGRFKGLNNQRLSEYGKKQKFYPGIPEFLEITKKMVSENDDYASHGISLEHYVISTGFAQIIRGSSLVPSLSGIWGCEVLDEEISGDSVMSELVYTIDNTSKTRALYEINKGTDKIDGVEVNSAISSELRRVRFENMIYIADGPSDIPAFSLLKEKGGSTFAIYPKGDMEALKQVERLRYDGRVDMYAEADYTESSTANMWIKNKVNQIAEGILKAEKDKILSSVSEAPKHLT